MKYRVLWSRRPLSAIEEEEEEEEEDEEEEGEGEGEGDGVMIEDSYLDDLVKSSDASLGCYTSAETPYQRLLPSPGVDCPQETSTLPEGSASLTDTLNRILNTATINIVGFEESFASHLNTDACSLMWNLCQLYGKTRMAIDLVEKELLDAKQEMAHVQHFYEDLSEAQLELCSGIAKTRYMRESVVKDTAAWKKKYRRIKNENTLLKLKANRYQLHLDEMEMSCSDTANQNYAVKAFLAICREKKKSKLKAANFMSHPGRMMVGGDNHVNGKFCRTPRRHCPKVTLCLPESGETESESSPNCFEFPPGYKKQISVYDRSDMQKMAIAVPGEPEYSRTNVPHYNGSAVVTSDIPSRHRKIADAELAEAAKQLRSGAKTADIDDVGFVIIPEFELNEKEETLAMRGSTPACNGSDNPITQTKVGESQEEAQADYHQNPFMTEGIGLAKDDKELRSEDTGIKKTVAFNTETDATESGSSDHLANCLRDSVSTYLAEPNRTKPSEKIVVKQTISSQILQKVTDTSLQSPRHKGSGRYPQLPPCMMARGYSLRKEVPSCTNESWSSYTSSWTTCRCQRCKRSRTQNYQHPATCTAIHIEQPIKPRPKARAASVVMGTPTALPPLPCPQHGNKYSGSTTISNESKSVSIRDRKLPPCFPALCRPEKQMKTRVRKSADEKPSDKVRAQVRSFSRQVLPVLSTPESTNMKFHQVLLISGGSSEKHEGPNTCYTGSLPTTCWQR